MNNERKLLRAEKTRYKEQLASLKNFLREMSDRCVQHNTPHEHCREQVMKAEHDAQFYGGQIKEISARLKMLALKAKR